jgi:hypothetical protein
MMQIIYLDFFLLINVDLFISYLIHRSVSKYGRGIKIMNHYLSFAPVQLGCR